MSISCVGSVIGICVYQSRSCGSFPSSCALLALHGPGLLIIISIQWGPLREACTPQLMTSCTMGITLQCYSMADVHTRLVTMELTITTPLLYSTQPTRTGDHSGRQAEIIPAM